MAFALSIGWVCAARASATTEPGADSSRAERNAIGVLLCPPTAPTLPRGERGDFGTSPIYGQLSDKPPLALCIISIITWRDMKHNRVEN
jgi:hypothetical protein